MLRLLTVRVLGAIVALFALLALAYFADELGKTQAMSVNVGQRWFFDALTPRLDLNSLRESREPQAWNPQRLAEECEASVAWDKTLVPDYNARCRQLVMLPPLDDSSGRFADVVAFIPNHRSIILRGLYSDARATCAIVSRKGRAGMVYEPSDPTGGMGSPSAFFDTAESLWNAAGRRDAVALRALSEGIGKDDIFEGLCDGDKVLLSSRQLQMLAQRLSAFVESTDSL